MSYESTHYVYGVAFYGTDAECRTMVRRIVATREFHDKSTIEVLAAAGIDPATSGMSAGDVSREFFLVVCDAIDAVVAERKTEETS